MLTKSTRKEVNQMSEKEKDLIVRISKAIPKLDKEKQSYVLGVAERRNAVRILKEMLNTLKSIDGTLKRIEQSVSEEKQHEVIKEAVSHAMVGERYEPTPKDF
jgi:hypothetical protein